MGYGSWPLFVLLRMVAPLNGSLVNRVFDGPMRLREIHNTRDIAIPVIKRIFRDGRRMPANDYLDLVLRVSRRYGARSLHSWGFEIIPTIGHVFMSDGELEYVGKGFDSDARIAFREAAFYRCKEMQKKKYQGLNKETSQLITLIKEIEGLLYGKTWILRQKNIKRSEQRSGVNLSSVATYGRCYQ